MARENKTQYALLGYLHYKPLSGYDLKKMIDESIKFFWSENYGHIYPVLKRLEKQGYVTRDEEQNPGKPTRKVYTITEAGRTYFGEWMERPPEPEKIRKEILLKLFFSGFVPESPVVEYIETEKRIQEELIDSYDNVKKHIDTHSQIPGKHKDLWMLTVECGYEKAQAEIRWCDLALKSLKK